MKNKVLLLLLLLLPITINGSELVTQQLEPVQTGQVCAFQDYYLTFDDPTTSKEIIVADAQTSRILSANSIKGEEYQLIFPSNIKELNVIVNEYVSDGVIETELFSLTVSNCGYSETKEDYQLTTLDKFVLAGNTIDMFLDNQANVNKVTAGSIGGKQKKIEPTNDRYTLPLEEGEHIYRVNIEYNDGTTRNYELDCNPQEGILTSRIVQPEASKKHSSKIDMKWLTITLVLLVLYLVLRVLHRKAKRREKKYLQYVRKRRG